MRSRRRTFAIASLTLLAALSAGTVTTSAADARASRSDVVRTDGGLIMGNLSGAFRTFLGVGYAAPPVGELRWRPPRPAATWDGVRDAASAPAPCAAPPLPPFVAIPSRDGSTTEDCLYLNVYTPRPGPNLRELPVMVWFHGGAFVNGAGTDVDGRVLSAKANAVVVTVNYRLGPFGFLALPGLTAESPDRTSGNLGLQDQQAALGWVQRNAAAFGGDPDNVTIFGESAGGASVCAHMVSPGARGLFDRAIVQSSPCTNPRPTLAAAEMAGAGIAERVGCTDPASQVACMRSKPAAEILAVTSNAPGSFGPNVDGVVIPRQIGAALAAGQFSRVPTMHGTTHDEYRLHVALGFDLMGGPMTEEQYPLLVQAGHGSNAPSVQNEYPLGEYPTPGIAFATLTTDASYACPAREASALLADHTRVFAFEFNDPDAPPYLLNVIVPGAIHGSEIEYVFQPVDAAASGRFTREQVALSDEMIGYWGRFAATGDPNGGAAPHWQAYSQERDRLQSLQPAGSRPTSRFAADHRCSFWSSLPSG